VILKALEVAKANPLLITDGKEFGFNN